MSHTHPSTAVGSPWAPVQTALAYSYDSRLVYVIPGESYDQAIELAQDTFPELKDVDRDLICLEIRVTVTNETKHKIVRISRTAWPIVLSTLLRCGIVDVRVASPPHANAVSQLPPYISEGSRVADDNAKGSQPNPVSPGPRSSHSLSRPKSLVTRVVESFCSRSPRCSQTPQPH